MLVGGICMFVCWRGALFLCCIWDILIAHHIELHFYVWKVLFTGNKFWLIDPISIPVSFAGGRRPGHTQKDGGGRVSAPPPTFSTSLQLTWVSPPSWVFLDARFLRLVQQNQERKKTPQCYASGTFPSRFATTKSLVQVLSEGRRLPIQSKM